MVKVCAGFWALVAGLPVLVAAQDTSTTPPVSASTFWHEETETQFSVNVANDSSDVFIYFSSPAYSWVGFGFGERMENSLMFIMYSNDKGDNITLSPRLGSRASEPTFTPTITLDILPGTSINDSLFTLAARCSNCRVWPNGYLDVTTHAQPFIYAFGPPNNLYSSSPSANLKRHVRYGDFTMDMLAATGPGGVPAQTRVQSGVRVAPRSMTRDRDGKNIAHAVLGCAALFVLWPVNVLVAGLIGNARVRGVVSGLLLVCLGIAYVLGGLTSGEYNRSKTYNTPHQILAFLSLLPLTLTSLLPILPFAFLTAKLPSLHDHLSSLALIALLLTGGFGLNLSQQLRPMTLGYTALALLIFALCTSLSFCLRRRHTHHGRQRLGSTTSSSSRDGELMLGKLEERQRGSLSSTTLTPVPRVSRSQAYGGAQECSREFGADGQRGPGAGAGAGAGARVTGLNSVMGGGAMPGPKYLLNMHPGVPVQVSRM